MGNRNNASVLRLWYYEWLFLLHFNRIGIRHRHHKTSVKRAVI